MGWREARGANEASAPNAWGSQFSLTELRHSAFQGSGLLLSRASHVQPSLQYFRSEPLLCLMLITELHHGSGLL